jgi:hypothetical protein
VNSTKRLALIAIGLFLATVAAVLLLSRGGALFAPEKPATEVGTQGCDLQRHPCSVDLPGGGKLTLAFEPRPVHPMKDFSLRLETGGLDVNTAVISFTGVDMNMGLNRFALKPEADGFSGNAILPICVRNRMEWEGRLRVSTPQGDFEAPFRFFTEKQ